MNERVNPKVCVCLPLSTAAARDEPLAESLGDRPAREGRVSALSPPSRASKGAIETTFFWYSISTLDIKFLK